MNSLKVKATINAAFKKMDRWPRWYLLFQIWRHRNGPIARMLMESGAGDCIMERMDKGISNE
jgi:hypothetical protein